MRDNSERAQLAIYLIVGVMLMDVITIWSSYSQLNLLSNVLDGVSVADEALEANDMREAMVGLFYSGVFIISAVVFIQWFRRAYYNLHTQTDGLSYSEGWAAGGWFVPFLNLIRPYEIMKELFAVTRKLLSTNTRISFGRKSHNLIGVWWALWIGSNVISQISAKMLTRADTIEGFMWSSKMEIFSSLVGIPLGLAAIKLIKDYSEMEAQLYLQRTTVRQHNQEDKLTDLAPDDLV